jgi:acetolactate synthase small subunit
MVDATGNTAIYEISASPQAIDKLVNELRPMGLLEVARSGSIAMSCGDAVLEAPPAAAALKSA